MGITTFLNNKSPITFLSFRLHSFKNMVAITSLVSFLALASMSTMAAPAGTTTATSVSASATPSSSKISSSSPSKTSSSSSSKTSSSSSSSTGSVTITVKNSCSNSIQVNQLTNGGGSGGQSSTVSAGGSTKISVDKNWGGRIWAREGCSGGSDCQSGSPASLAEFLMSGSGGKDYYDVSFVDGYNLPISISPNGGQSDGKYECGSPGCSSLPDCPEELQDKQDGKVVACKSACSAFGTGEYCCTGDSEARGTCKASKFSTPIKDACPDVYTYAYDDSTSMYACSPSDGYTVTFC